MERFLFSVYITDWPPLSRYEQSTEKSIYWKKNHTDFYFLYFCYLPGNASTGHNIYSIYRMYSLTLLFDIYNIYTAFSPEKRLHEPSDLRL